MAVNGHARRLDAVARRLTPDPDQLMTIEHVSQAISELEADAARTHLVGMPRDRFMALVTDETERLTPAEYDRLIDAYTRHQAGEQLSLASKWPVSQMDRWVNELIEEGIE